MYDKEKVKEKWEKWISKPGNRERHLQQRREWWIKNREKLKPIRSAYNKWRRDSGYTKAYYQRIRLQVLTHYGGQPPKCKCCGENHLEFLGIDHIKGGGNKHRESLKRKSLWSWFISQDYPKGFRVLCHNCNMALGFYGYCPHKKYGKPTIPKRPKQPRSLQSISVPRRL